MIDLSLYPLFAQDIKGHSVNIHPVIIIKGNPEIYISQNEEVMNVNGVQTHFPGLDLKIPSIKESIDLESKKIKINNVTVSLSNYGSTHDYLFSQSLINKYVEVYWKSQSCRDIEDCLLVYKALIKRIDHDKNYIKLQLEDLTEGVIHKEVPIASIEPKNAYNDEYVNRTIPMTYGVVDKAPAVLWATSEYDNQSGNISNNYLFAITDRFDLSNVGDNDVFSGHNLDNTQTTNSRSPISMFTGNYLWINPTYMLHENAYDYSSTNQWQLFGGKVRFSRQFEGETPLNSIAEDIAQITVNRSATSASLLDSNSVEGINYQGETENISIEGKDLLLTKYNISNYGDTSLSPWNVYAGIPIIELDSFGGNSQTEDGWTPLSVFRTSEYFSVLSQMSGDASTFQDHRYGNNTETFDYDVPAFNSESPVGYNNLLASLIFHAEDVNCEIVTLPDSKKLYDYYVEWYSQTHGSASNIKSWETGDHRWSGCLVEGHNWAIPFFRIEFSGSNNFNYILFTETRVETDDGVEVGMIGDSEEGIYEFQDLDWFFDPFYSSHSYDTYYEEYHDHAIYGGQYADTSFMENLQDRPYNVQFWTLIEQVGGRFYGQVEEGLDIPRYRLNSLLGSIDYSQESRYGAVYAPGEDVQTQTDYWKYLKSYNADWNGIPNSIWGNTGLWGGYSEGSEDNCKKIEFSCYPYIRPAQAITSWSTRLYESDAETFNWNRIYSRQQNWFLHIKDGGDSGSIIGDSTIPGGLLIPAQTFYNYQEWQSSEPPGWDGYNGVLDTRVKMRYPDGFFTTHTAAVPSEVEDDYVTIRDGSAALDDLRVGIAYSLEDAGVESVLGGSGITQFWGKFSYKPLCENTTDITTASLKVNFLQADLENDDINTLESDGVGVLKAETFNTLANTQGERTFDSIIYYPTNVISSIWAEPSDFNAGLLRFWADDPNSTNAVAPINIRLHHLGVKHIIDIEEIFDKDFYVNSDGRGVGSNPLAIIRDIIETELEIIPSLHQSYDDNYGVGANWNLGFSVTKKVNSKKLIEDISNSTPFIPYFKSTQEGSSLAFTMIKSEYNFDSPEVDVKEVVAKDVISSKYSRTKIENVKTICRVKYKKDYGRDSFSEVTEYRDAYDLFGNGDYTNNSDHYSKEYLGLDPSNPGDSVLEVENEYIRDMTVANRLRDFLVAFHCNQHTIIECKLPLTYVDLEIADVVRFDEAIENQRAYGEDYSLPFGTYLRNGQEVYPYFMVTSVNKSIKSVSIQCIQLHKLTPGTNFLATGVGDVLRKGDVPNQDDWLLLLDYLLGYNEYFTEGQKQNADVALDGLINYNDLSLLSELVGLVDIGSGIDAFLEFETETALGVEISGTSAANRMKGFHDNDNTEFRLRLNWQTNSYEPFNAEDDINREFIDNSGFVLDSEGNPLTSEDNYSHFDSGDYYIQIGTGSDKEMVKILSSSFDNVYGNFTVQRGALGTTARGHFAGEYVALYKDYQGEGV